MGPSSRTRYVAKVVGRRVRYRDVGRTMRLGRRIRLIQVVLVDYTLEVGGDRDEFAFVPLGV